MIDQVGCKECWPGTLEATESARLKLSIKAYLINDSHFIVAIRVCPKCAQYFLSVFAESIDWEDGDDPQHSTLLPLTDVEAQDLMTPFPEEALYSLGQGRRSFQRYHPKGESSQLLWGSGVPRVPHD